MNKAIKYKCQKCGFEFELFFDPDMETEESLEEIRTCPCGETMDEEVVEFAE